MTAERTPGWGMTSTGVLHHLLQALVAGAHRVMVFAIEPSTVHDDG
jgi:hypothetical protein